MDNEKKYSFTVGELMEVLKQFPPDLPVVVSGYDSGYENFYYPFVNKVKHFPENMFRDGAFQPDEKGTEVLILEREFRDE